MKLNATSAAEDDKLSIAVIDGDPLTRERAAYVLGSDATEVHAFDTAESFLRQTHGHHYACLVIDSDLPDMSSLELQRMLQVLGISSPVVIYGEIRDVATVIKALRQGATEFVSKPIDGQLLRRVVCEAIKFQPLHHKRRLVA